MSEELKRLERTVSSIERQALATKELAKKLAAEATGSTLPGQPKNSPSYSRAATARSRAQAKSTYARALREALDQASAVLEAGQSEDSVWKSMQAVRDLMVAERGKHDAKAAKRRADRAGAESGTDVIEDWQDTPVPLGDSGDAVEQQQPKMGPEEAVVMSQFRWRRTVSGGLPELGRGR